ncbi:MAG TPA: 50S ribosomal protein L20 [Candidatus Hydrothermia bacterium]|nr:50S ribosomal protein L20 [Candidatus Hydrothermia bacterium]
MMRIKTGFTRRRRHKKIHKAARGYFGQKHSTFKKANEAVLRSLQYSYAHRRLKKHDMRKLWIIRINAAAREEGLNYSTFMAGLRKANVNLNRKVLADLAVGNTQAFSELAKLAKTHVNS